MLISRTGVPNVWLKPLAPYRGALVCDFSLQLMSYCARDVSSDSTVSLPPLLLLFFLYILSCRSTFLLVFRLSSGRVSYVCCSLGYPWEEVISGSSYSAILIPPPKGLSNLPKITQ